MGGQSPEGLWDNVHMTVVPFPKAEQGGRAREETAAVQSPLTGLKVLVVEDDEVVAEAAAMMLADVGAQIVGPCATVTAALAALEQNPVDLALLDVDLKGMRSNAVAQALDAKQIPYVAATGYTIAAAAAGAPVILNKPYTQAKSRAALESAIAD